MYTPRFGNIEIYTKQWNGLAVGVGLPSQVPGAVLARMNYSQLLLRGAGVRRSLGSRIQVG